MWYSFSASTEASAPAVLSLLQRGGNFRRANFVVFMSTNILTTNEASLTTLRAMQAATTNWLNVAKLRTFDPENYPLAMVTGIIIIGRFLSWRLYVLMITCRIGSSSLHQVGYRRSDEHLSAPKTSKAKPVQHVFVREVLIRAEQVRLTCKCSMYTLCTSLPYYILFLGQWLLLYSSMYVLICMSAACAH